MKTPSYELVSQSFVGRCQKISFPWQPYFNQFRNSLLSTGATSRPVSAYDDDRITREPLHPVSRSDGTYWTMYRQGDKLQQLCFTKH